MKKLSIAQIKNLFAKEEINEEMFEQLRADGRKGVQQLVKQYDKRLAMEREARERFLQLVQFDEQFKHTKTDLVAGVDEAGRGPLAGPLVAAAVILPIDFTLVGLNDSKQLNEGRRKQYYEQIIEEAISFHVAIVDNVTIDKINIYEATKLAMMEAVEHLAVQPDVVLVDAVNLPQLPMRTEAIIKGDAQSVAIAAASILAKVTRDEIMYELDEKYPQYDFKGHKGYGTKVHIDALEKYGATPYHRFTFSPVKQLT